VIIKADNLCATKADRLFVTDTRYFFACKRFFATLEIAVQTRVLAEVRLDLAEQKPDSLLWKAKMAGLVKCQFAVVLISCGLLLFWQDWQFIASFAMGGALVVLNTAIMAKTFAGEHVNQRLIYKSAVLRYIGFLTCLIVLAAVGAKLLAVCSGICVTYLASYIFSMIGAAKERQQFIDIN
jgi:hypothetical protein